ncbi:hypothetical protein PIB30_105878, partial [Stylosanthes scabra]|nr:hypothetical protein [Stylosanthes scabra]
METVPRDLFSIRDQSDSEARQTFFNEQHEHLTTPSITTDNGELVLERNDLHPTVIEMTFAQEHEAEDS